VRRSRVFARICGVEGGVVEDVCEDADGAVVVHARPRARRRSRCGVCGRRSPGYDQGIGRRRWRALDLGVVRCFVEADAPRVACRRHGVTTAQVPWARHRAWHTRSFEEVVCWLATQASTTAICRLMRVSWSTVGQICARVVGELETQRPDRLEGLRRIGVDELSYRVGQRYITVVVDHDTGRLVWAKEGRDRATVRAFFDALGAERTARIEAVSSDLGGWVTREVAASCPAAVLCIDPFHVVALATGALDVVRREVWNDARRAGDQTQARWLKGARYAVWKNPEHLTGRQRAKLATITTTNRRLYRAYLLKEQLRAVFHADSADAALAILDAWLRWASRSRLGSFVKLARTLREHRQGIEATLRLRLTNARIEAVNTTLRLIVRRAYGFHSATALIALAMLTCGGLRPALPGRAAGPHGPGW
jgi:transposase